MGDDLRLVLEVLVREDLYAESGQTLQGSFSAVSTPIFASKYSLESSRRDLHSALLCTALESNPKKRGKPWGGKDPGPIPGKMATVLKAQIFVFKIAENFANFR